MKVSFGVNPCLNGACKSERNYALIWSILRCTTLPPPTPEKFRKGALLRKSVGLLSCNEPPKPAKTFGAFSCTVVFAQCIPNSLLAANSVFPIEVDVGAFSKLLSSQSADNHELAKKQKVLFCARLFYQS